MSVSLSTPPSNKITKGTYFVDNKTLRLYCVLGLKRNRTVLIIENCRTLKETDIRIVDFDEHFKEGVRIINAGNGDQ